MRGATGDIIVQVRGSKRAHRHKHGSETKWLKPRRQPETYHAVGGVNIQHLVIRGTLSIVSIPQWNKWNIWLQREGVANDAAALILINPSADTADPSASRWDDQTEQSNNHLNQMSTHINKTPTPR